MLAIALLSLAAVPQLRIVADPPASLAAAQAGVEVFALNEGDSAVDAVPPILDIVTADGFTMEIAPVDPASVPVPAGGFRRLRYIIAWSATPAATTTAASARRSETQVATAAGTASALLDRFEPHAPIYGAFGLESDGAKLQFSLAFRPFDGTGALDGVRLAWTQTMFWAIDRSSGPFRSTNYSPEVYYERTIGDRMAAAAGYAHDSNGRGDIGSIDVNRIYLGGTYALPLGDGWAVEASPRAWTYVGTGYRDLDRYWGHASLGLGVGQAGGMRIAVSLRNPTGRHRAGELHASWPLGKTGLYLFGQGFAGYGEAIDEYRRYTATARLGVAFTR